MQATIALDGKAPVTSREERSMTYDGSATAKVVDHEETARRRTARCRCRSGDAVLGRRVVGW